MSETVEIEIDDARELMYEELVDEFGERIIHNMLEDAVRDQVTGLYDNRDQFRQQAQQ